MLCRKCFVCVGCTFTVTFEVDMTVHIYTGTVNKLFKLSVAQVYNLLTVTLVTKWDILGRITHLFLRPSFI